MAFARTIETTLMTEVVDISLMVVPPLVRRPPGGALFEVFDAMDMCDELDIGIIAHFTNYDLPGEAHHLLSIFAGLCLSPFVENVSEVSHPGTYRRAWVTTEGLALLDKLNNLGLSALSKSSLGELFSKDAIVVVNSPPGFTSFASVLNSGSGAIIGAYTGYAAGQGSPLLLLVTVPAGMLICASAMALAQALEHGLKSGLSKLLVGDKTGPGGDDSGPEGDQKS